MCADFVRAQRQTVVSQFFQLDRLVVEGGKTGKQTGGRNDIMRVKDQGYDASRHFCCGEEVMANRFADGTEIRRE